MLWYCLKSQRLKADESSDITFGALELSVHLIFSWVQQNMNFMCRRQFKNLKILRKQKYWNHPLIWIFFWAASPTVSSHISTSCFFFLILLSSWYWSHFSIASTFFPGRFGSHAGWPLSSCEIKIHTEESRVRCVILICSTVGTPFQNYQKFLPSWISNCDLFLL